MSHSVNLQTIGAQPRAFVLTPDAPTRAAIATRLRIEAVEGLTCRFTLRRDRRTDRVLAEGEISARIVQLDSLTLDPFPAEIAEPFHLRFLPETDLPELVDPADPVDDVGLTDDMVDLDELMIQQLALALDPYPRA